MAKSEKSDKVIYHRRFRKAVKRALQKGEEVLPHFREFSNPWMFAKDGKMMFDKEKDKKLLRK